MLFMLYVLRAGLFQLCGSLPCCHVMLSSFIVCFHVFGSWSMDMLRIASSSDGWRLRRVAKAGVWARLVLSSADQKVRRV